MTIPRPVVTGQWLAENRDRVALADVRWALGEGPKRDDYERGHLPGAVFVDLDTDLSDPPGERGRHPLPSAEQFAETRARLGLHGRPVVVYDDQSGAQAGRLWWMLDAIGQEVSVLDGGLQAWSGEVESGPGPDPDPDVGSVAPVPWPTDRFVEADDLLDVVAAGGVLVDARSHERFIGTPNPIDPRPGHVPGARSRPWTDNIGSDGRFLPVEELRAALARVGVEAGVDVVASCGSGVTGCHDLLAARIVGVDGGRLYTGSWSEWALDENRPVATGEADQPDR